MTKLIVLMNLTDFPLVCDQLDIWYIPITEVEYLNRTSHKISWMWTSILWMGLSGCMWKGGVNINSFSCLLTISFLNCYSVHINEFAVLVLILDVTPSCQA